MRYLVSSVLGVSRQCVRGPLHTSHLAACRFATHTGVR